MWLIDKLFGRKKGLTDREYIAKAIVHMEAGDFALRQSLRRIEEHLERIEESEDEQTESFKDAAEDIEEGLAKLQIERDEFEANALADGDDTQAD